MLTPKANFSRTLLTWYERARRDLPWRPPLNSDSHTNPDPYAVLVSELMLQQTQVATVIPYFHRFMHRFPSVNALAAADEQDVLILWQGLGYYSRARNLLKAARQIVTHHAGIVPSNLDALQNLPGIGRYTAGAIASLAYGIQAPILDGNVSRVLCRLDKIQTDPRTPKTRDHLWHRATQILPAKRVGDFNSALMELGATLCTPKSPHCPACPVQKFCEAFAANLQNEIPLRRATKPTPLFHRWTICLNHKNTYLIEQRPPKGRWPGLWQFITIEPSGKQPTKAMIAKHLKIQISPIQPLGSIPHALTHRRYIFEAFQATVINHPPEPGTNQRWVTLQDLSNYPLPKPHLKIAGLLAGIACV